MELLGAEVNVQSDWNETNTNSDAYIQNKPTIPSETKLSIGQDQLLEQSTALIYQHSIKTQLEQLLKQLK